MMEMDVSTDPNHSNAVLQEDDLRQMSRHVKTIVPSSGTNKEELNKFVQLFESVVSTSSSNNLSATHRVAAWNTLCALIDWTAESQEEGVLNLLWTADLWQSALELYLGHSDNARPKSSRQLLVALVTALRKFQQRPDTHPVYLKHAWVKWKLQQRLIEALTAPEARRDTKASLNLLVHLLSKDVISFDLLCEEFMERVQCGRDDTLEHVFFAAFEWISKAEFPSVVGQLVAVMLDKQSNLGFSGQSNDKLNVLVPVWAAPLKKTLLNDQENTEAYRAHVFPMLLKRDVRQFVAFVQYLGLGKAPSQGLDSSNTESSELVLAMVLQTGKALGIVDETNGTDVVIEIERVLIPMRLMARMLQSSERGVRLAGLSLMISSHSITKPFDAAVLRQLRRNLPHFHADTDANFRSELFSLTQRMLDRMRASTSALARSAGRANQLSTVEKTLGQQEQFVRSYCRFLAWELRQTASYQRHISALKCLSLLMRSGVDNSIPKDRLSKSASADAHWPFDVPLIDDGMQRLLLDLLMDPFDDVRQSSAAILGLHSSSATSAAILPAGINNALQAATSIMLASGRADHADGVAHMHALSYTVGTSSDNRHKVLIDILGSTDSMLQVADGDLATAVDKFPLHGLLTSLRYILLRYDGPREKRAALYDSLLRKVQHVWKVVKPTLCDDAPEGYLPEEMEELPEISTKDILSYCWRALKEASLLMCTMLTPSVMQNCTSPEFKSSVFELCFQQLAELRHRGAFSTVAQTWVSCCSLMTHDNSSLSLSTWHKRAMNLLRTSLTINTRRSAGLPSLICGILIAAKSHTLFSQAFADLETISRSSVNPETVQEGSLPQVHAMNCMKDILKNTRLAQTSEQYVPAALRLAADSLRSEAWAIRNCGLMLFRAVIDRLLGTNDAYLDEGVASKKRVEFEQAPELLEIVMGLLSDGSAAASPQEGARNEGVFPALQLLQRATIPKARREEVSRAVLMLTGNPSWHVRDKAARTHASFVPMESTSVAFGDAMTNKAPGQNALHGALLCGKYLLRRIHARIHARIEARLPDPYQTNSSLGSNGHVSRRTLLDFVETEATGACPYVRAAFFHVETTAKDLTMLVGKWVDPEDVVPESWGAGSSTVPGLEGDHAQVAAQATGDLSEQAALELITNATQADAWLEARALHLEALSTTHPSASPSLISPLREWAQACHTSLSSSSIFSSEAAVRGLVTFSHLWNPLTMVPSLDAILNLLCLTLYDLLNDDDEDVRILASHTTTSLLSTASPRTSVGRLVPLVASQRLISFLLSRWPSSPSLACTALDRAFGPSTVSVAEQLSSSEKKRQDYALFAEEKQNLYIDDAREARLWTQLTLKLPPTTIPRPLLNSLAKWTLEGLNTLTAHVREKGDGPSGVSSDEEVFVLGLRVVWAAEFILGVVGKGARVGFKPSEVRRGLVGLLGVLEEGVGGRLWRGEVMRVLSAALVGRIRGVWRLVKVIEGG